MDPPTRGGLASRLFPPLPVEADWSLERVEAALSLLGDPHRSFETLHAGGTNGKGTVVAVWDSVLRAGSRRVGRYTSPHLVRFNERFRVDGLPATDDELMASAREVREAVLEHGLTFFEAATVLAFHHFRRSGVEIAAVEVGLGGRLDATNVLRPAVTAVTNVDLDHAEYLGQTLEEVAVEKAGIAKPGVPLVTAETQPGVVAVLRRETQRRGGLFHRIDPAPILAGASAEIRRGSRFEMETDTWGRLQLETSLIGGHQVTDVALAVRAIDLLDDRLRPSGPAVVEGVRRARWPGRLQVESAGGATWILDVAHNPAAASALAGTLGTVDAPRPRVLVFGCMADKDGRSMIGALAGWADHRILTRVPGAPPERAWDPHLVARRRDGGEDPSGMVEVRVELDPSRALERAGELAGLGGTVLVTGAHLLVGAAMEQAGLDPEG